MTAEIRTDAAATHDDLVKALLSQPRLLADFFRAFVPEVLEFADLSAVEYLDKEHPRSRRRPRRSGDLLVKVRWKGRETVFLIHIESQGRAEAAVLQRLVEYAMRDSIRYGIPVMPVLLLTYPKPEKPHPNTLDWQFGQVASIRIHCPVLHFHLMDPRPHLEGGNVAALALSSLMDLDGDQQVEAIVRTLAGALRQGFSEEELAAATEFVRHYAPLDEEQLLQLERRVRILSENDPLLAPMPALVNPFVELGKLKGREEGRLEGRAEGELAVLQRLLKRKFPRLPRKAIPLLKSLDEPGLLAFGEALLFFETEAECLAWLESR